MRRFVATQYYYVNQGRYPDDHRTSHIGVISASLPLGDRFSFSATLPLESEREPDGGRETGVHDPVLGFRYFPNVGHDRKMIAVFTLEPPASRLEHRALGVGTGLMYNAERGHWSGVVYALGRTEHTFDRGERRGNRLFLGGGVAYEHQKLPFSPQLGLSWERVGRRLEDGQPVEASKTSAVMLHPTLVKTLQEEKLQLFFVVSVPVAQRSGSEGWQRWRIATGAVWVF
jgi:hypothetical protein